MNESIDHISKMLTQSSRQNASGSDIVAVAEPARHTQNLVAIFECRILDQAIDVHTLGDRPAFSNANAVSSSQLVPGARRINTRGEVMLVLSRGLAGFGNTLPRESRAFARIGAFSTAPPRPFKRPTLPKEGK